MVWGSQAPLSQPALDTQAGMLASALTGIVVVTSIRAAWANVSQGQLRDPLAQGIVRIWIDHQSSDGQEALLDRQRWTPGFLEDV